MCRVMILLPLFLASLLPGVASGVGFPDTSPDVLATKAWTLHVDQDGTGTPLPGDVIRYSITLENAGVDPLTLTVLDSIPLQVQSWAMVSFDGGVDESTPSVLRIGNLIIEPYNAAEIVFDVTIAADAGGQAMVNTAHYSDESGGSSGSTTAAEVLICLPVTTIAASKTWTLQSDEDGTGDPTPGDGIRYRVILENMGVTPVVLAVADPMPPQVASWSIVSFGSGSNESSPSTLMIADIVIPSESLEEVVFDVVIAEGTEGESLVNIAEYSLAPCGDFGSVAASEVIIGQVTGIPGQGGEGTSGFLRNRPNPFTRRTTIAFESPGRESVSLRVYDLGGRLVETLLEDRTARGGWNQVVWQASREDGTSLPPGIYFCRLDTASRVEIAKMIVLP